MMGQPAEGFLPHGGAEGMAGIRVDDVMEVTWCGMSGVDAA